jgi:HrpA-like RNA helicase
MNTDSGLQAFRRALPVYEYQERIVQTIQQAVLQNQVVLIMADTGSGKSTQIPAYLLNVTQGGGRQLHRMAVSQPRRVAAITLARRVSQEQSEVLGQRIGYRVRFDDCTTMSHGSNSCYLASADTRNTQLVYVTAGMLLREALQDPLLLQYSIIFVDEAHERSLPTDILLGILQHARRIRNMKTELTREYPPLTVVVMSATLHLETFSKYFGGVQAISIPGRTYPVQTLYLAPPENNSEPSQDYLELALSTVLRIHFQEEGGNEKEPADILVFLPGQEEIETLAMLLRQYLQQYSEHHETHQKQKLQWTGDRVEVLSKATLDSSSSVLCGMFICPMYAALPPEAQLLAFAPRPVGCTRKVVLATNIAETSITIPDIRYVVDSGRHKARQVISATSGMESLKVEYISQNQAIQRQGRAGRVMKGVCFRLYTQDLFDRDWLVDSVPEILRVNLSQVVLQLKGMGIQDPTSFEFVTPPSKAAIVQATKLLFALGALDDRMNLTLYGKQLAALPLDPIYGHLLLSSIKYECVFEVLTVVAVLSADHLFVRPGGVGSFGSLDGDATGQAAKATGAHRRFYSHEGDLPTYLNVYECWRKEAIYVPPSAGGIKRAKKKLRQLEQQSGRPNGVLHAEWCTKNYISGRALSRAYHVREQLCQLLKSSSVLRQQQLGSAANHKDQPTIDVNSSSSARNDPISLFKCFSAGFFLQVASRLPAGDSAAEPSKRDKQRFGGTHRSRDAATGNSGRYKTKIGNQTVSIHPASTLFNRQPSLPACVVYTELVTTTNTYIRGVTQIREEWLPEIAPSFYQEDPSTVGSAKPATL